MSRGGNPNHLSWWSSYWLTHAISALLLSLSSKNNTLKIPFFWTSKSYHHQTPFSHESLPTHNPMLLLRFLTTTSVSHVPYWHGLALSIVSIGIEIENLNLCEFLTSYHMSISAVTLYQRRKKSAINWKFLLHIFYIWIISDLDRSCISKKFWILCAQFLLKSTFYITNGVFARLRNQHCSDPMIYLWHLDVATSHVFFFCYQHILVPQSMPMSFTHSGSGLSNCDEEPSWYICWNKINFLSFSSNKYLKQAFIGVLLYWSSRCFTVITEAVQCCSAQCFFLRQWWVYLLGTQERAGRGSADLPPGFLGYFSVFLLLTGAADKHTGESSLYWEMAISLPLSPSQQPAQSAWDEQGWQSRALCEWHVSLVPPLAVGLHQHSLSASCDLWHLLMLRERRVRGWKGNTFSRLRLPILRATLSAVFFNVWLW